MASRLLAPPARDSFADAKAQAFGVRTPREHFEAFVQALDLSFTIAPPERLAAGLDWQDPLPESSQLVLASDAIWVSVRPPRLTLAEKTGCIRSSTKRPLGTALGRADLAGFMLEALSDAQLVRQAPLVSA